ncbi:MAG: sugar transferase [Acidimicrobiia bacterium]
MRARFALTTAALDLLALAASAQGASYLLFDTPLPWVAAQPYGSIFPLLGSLVLGAVVGSYVTFRSLSGVPRPSYGRALTIIGITLGLTALFIVMARPFWSRSFLAWTFLLWTGLALAHRAVRRRRPWAEPMVLVTGEKALADDLLVSPHAAVVDVLDPSGPPPNGPPPPGSTVVVDFRSLVSDEMARFVSSANLAGYRMASLSRIYEDHTGRLPIVHLHEGWELTVPLERAGVYEEIKRLLDVVAVLVVTPLALVVGSVVAAAIRLNSPGPVIFRQRRVGRHGQPFTMYKFRTMLVHEESAASPYPQPEDGRLTRVGRVVRRFRADELPQLWNVLRGDVSLVGPRPEWERLADLYVESIPFYTFRQLVRPGITGWAQVNFGYADSEADVVDRLSYDLYYVKHMSPWLDLQVLGRSIWTVLSGFGAK